MLDARPNPTLTLEYCAERPIFMDFLRHAASSPDATAVISQDATCSYRQLEAISLGIASFLISHGAAASDRVVIVSSRCAGLVYAMLGAARAGLTFTVADIAYPPARIDQIIQALQPSFILLGGEATVDLNFERMGPRAEHADPQVVSIPEMPTEALQAFPFSSGALPEVDPRQPAYITFTSGSTGEPKGIVAQHGPLVHFVEWHVRRHSLSKHDCFSLLSGLGHDPVYRDIFTPLSIGAKVIIPASSTVIDPSALATWLQTNRISIIHLTPPLGRLVEAGANINGVELTDLRYFFWGGDALNSSLYEHIRLIAPHSISVNFYGTTETPQAMAYHQIDSEASNARIPLGKGIEGAQLLVVDESNRLVSEGEVGEILIRSPYLSLGYWRDIEKTRERFVVNPFTHEENDLCYRTGDLGTYLADGSAIFLGRGDNQVKIRGHRIELAEIEGALSRHALITQCVVLAINDRSGTKLAACCVSKTPVSSVELREHVSRQLPDYMVPALFVFLDDIPLTPNGKIDRQALSSQLGCTDPVPLNASQSLSPLALKLADAWAEILKVPSIDANLSFVELGGDSLSFVQASMALETLLGQLPARWEVTPLRTLCEQAGEVKISAPFLREMELPVLLRVVAILLIVVGHFNVFSTWPIVGETTTLFIVSGISLARFQFNAIAERGNVRLLVRSIASIVVPTILYTLLIQLLFGKVHWQAVLLMSNWFPPMLTEGFAYWYIEVLVQMLLVIGFVLSFARVRAIIIADPFRCLIVASCALAVAGVLINAYVFDASVLYNRVPQHYLAVMVLGMAIHYADTRQQKWVASAVTVMVMGWQDVLAVFESGSHTLTMLEHIDVGVPAVLGVIWVRSVPVPDIIARALALIASSTLFIYLTHFQFQSVARRIVDQPVFAVVIAIVGGIAVGYVWNKGARRVLMRWSGGGKKSRAEKIERVA